MKKLIGIALIFCGIFILFGSVINGFGNWQASGEQNQRGSASLDGVQHIEISGSSAGVNIIPIEQENLTAELSGENAEDYDLTVHRNGDTVEVELGQQWFNWFSFHHQLTMDVYVPESFNQNMTVDIGSGSLEFSAQTNGDPMILKDFELDISSGDVDLGYLNLEELSADVSSGNVDANHINAGTATIDISSGNVNLTQYTGALFADISSGKLHTSLSDLSAPIEISVSSGSVDLDLPNKASFTLDGEVNSGHIHSDFKLNHSDTDDEDLIRGTHGTGKYPIQLDVSSGNISIY